MMLLLKNTETILKQNVNYRMNFYYNTVSERIDGKVEVVKKINKKK